MTATPTPLNSVKDKALFYLKERGFSVFVLQNPDSGNEVELRKRKAPAVPSKTIYEIASPTQIQVEKWFAKNPKYNIAAPTGLASRIIAIDVDGPTAAKRIREKIPDMTTNLRVALKNTMVTTTGSGGQHIIFRMEEPIIEHISTSKIWDDGKEHSEIKIIGNGNYIVLPPSRHPNGKLYESNNRTPVLLTERELLEFIRRVGTNPKANIPLKNGISTITTSAITKTEETEAEITTKVTTTTATGTATRREALYELLKIVKPYYLPGSRDEMIFCLSGFMRKDGGFSVEDTKALVIELCNSSGYPDEDLTKSLEVVENTYKKPLEGLKGKSGLHGLLVGDYDNSIGSDDNNEDDDDFKTRTEDYDRIFRIITANNKNKGEKLIDGCIVMELIDPEARIYAVVVSKDVYYDKVTSSSRPIRTIQQVQNEWNGEKKQYEHKFKSIILNAAPVPPIEIIHDPLFEQIKYKMVFEYVGPNNTIKREVVGPYTKGELKEYLIRQTPWVFKERMLTDTINHVIAAYTRKQDMAISRTEIETEGLIWLPAENKLILSQLKRYMPTPEEARQCIEVIHKLQEEFYPSYKGIERKRFAHFLKIGIVAPVDFARRQNGAVGSHGIIPRQDLSGWANSGKSYGYAGLALRMYRLPLRGANSKYVIAGGSVETEARFIERTRGTTMPVIIDDADFLSDWERDDRAKRCLPLIKNAAEMTNPRDILAQDSRRKNLPSCAYTMFTHNSSLINEDGFTRRSTGHEFTKDDEKTKEQIALYDKFFHIHGHTFGFLGDFAINYYLEHPEVLFNDWLTIANTILEAFYEYAGISSPSSEEEKVPPSWLLEEVIESAISQVGLAEVRTSNIAAVLHDIVQNQGWSRNKREAAIWIARNLRNELLASDLDYETGAVRNIIDNIMTNVTIEEKLESLLKLNALPHLRWHHEKQVCIMASVTEELKKHGVSRVSHTQLPSYLSGSKYESIWLGSKKHRVVHIKLEEFAALISPGQQPIIQPRIRQ